MSHTEVQTFFETYREAFNRLDGDAVADLWHTPAAIAHTGADIAIGQLTLWHDNLLRTAGGIRVVLATAYEEDIDRMKAGVTR